MAFATLPGVLSDGPDWCVRRYAAKPRADIGSRGPNEFG
jgi:hypothetical protein